MRIRVWSFFFAVSLLGCIISPGIGRAAPPLPAPAYDEFSGPLINPDKWFGTEAAGTATAPTAETIRKIVNKKLQLSLVFYGNETSNSEGPSGGLQRLRFTDPSSVTAIQAKIVVQKAEAQACPANTDTAKARAQIVGRFFNNGSSTEPTDETGDIFAGIEMQLDSTAGRRIRGFINRCDDSSCGAFTTIISQSFVTTWAVGAARTLQLMWDPGNDQFIYTVNPGAASEESFSLSYPDPDADPPVEQSKELRVNGDPVNCAGVGARKRTTTTAVFDNVFTQ